VAAHELLEERSLEMDHASVSPTRRKAQLTYWSKGSATASQLLCDFSPEVFSISTCDESYECVQYLADEALHLSASEETIIGYRVFIQALEGLFRLRGCSLIPFLALSV
jgi:hypothetical protein